MHTQSAQLHCGAVEIHVHLFDHHFAIQRSFYLADDLALHPTLEAIAGNNSNVAIPAQSTATIRTKRIGFFFLGVSFLLDIVLSRKRGEGGIVHEEHSDAPGKPKCDSKLSVP